MQPNDTAAAVGILQAAILAIPFWLTSTQYWLRQSYEEGDKRYRITSAVMGTFASIGLLTLLAAVRYSTDSILTDAGRDVELATRLIDLFTFVAFAMLVGSMGHQMAVDDKPKLALKYTMTFTVLAPAAIFVYLIGFGWMILVVGFIVLAVILVYAFKVRPWIIAHTREETNGYYPALGAAMIGFIHRIVNREKMGPLSPSDEQQFREVFESMGFSEERSKASIEQLRERYGTEADQEIEENGTEEADSA